MDIELGWLETEGINVKKEWDIPAGRRNMSLPCNGI